MKKSISKILLLVLTLSLVFTLFTACGDDKGPGEFIDYASQLTLDMSSATLKTEVTLYLHIDGDTTHFKVDRSVSDTGILKARYLAINTPESTGRVEDYGKKASHYTENAIKNAQSVIVEANGTEWAKDGNGRHLVFVWYRTSADAPYRNLNLELLQHGYAQASSATETIYGDICMKAMLQAKEHKLLVHSGVEDDEVYKGDAIKLSLKEIRANIEDYKDMRVSFEGVITAIDSYTYYIEEYDEETQMYYGISVYTLNADISGNLGRSLLKIGNRLRMVGLVQYWEGGGTYQISDIRYNAWEEDNPVNFSFISTNNATEYNLITADKFLNGKVDIERAGVTTAYDYAELAVSTTVAMNNLYVEKIYTTGSSSEKNEGAMTLTCKVDGQTVTVRTAVLKDADGNLITKDAYLNKTINVKGIIDYYDGDYQIKVFTPNNITIVE